METIGGSDFLTQKVEAYLQVRILGGYSQGRFGHFIKIMTTSV
jgi:hypothetical protein